MKKIKRVNDNRWKFILFVVVYFLGMISFGQDDIRVYAFAAIMYIGLWVVIQAIQFDFSKEIRLRINYNHVRVGDLFTLASSNRYSCYVIEVDTLQVMDIEYADIVVYPIKPASKFVTYLKIKWILFCYAINTQPIKYVE